MFRRLISMGLSICLLLTSLPLQALAETMPEHEHAYTSELTQDATCTQEGVTTYTCDCGDTFTMGIPQKEHIYEKGVCSVCGEQGAAAKSAETEAVTMPAETNTAPTVAETEAATEPAAAETEPAVEEPVQMAIPELLPLEDAVCGKTGVAVFSVQYQYAGEMPLEFQWQYRAADNSWKDIPGACKDTLEITGIRADNLEEYVGNEYRCMISLGEDQWGTNPARICVDALVDSIAAAPAALAAVEGDFSYNLVTLDDGTTVASITRYNGAEEDVTIPGTLDGYPVAIIGSGAFSYQDIHSIAVPEGVTEIADADSYYNGAFYNCDSLTAVSLPSTLTKIGKYAFYSCSKLEQITLPNSLLSIGDYAFASCDSLSSITLPKALKALGGYAFYSCDVITELSLPEGLETIGGHAFENCRNLTDITLPDSLTTLGEGAFQDCTSLKEIAVPNGVTALEASVFSGCSKLESITLPDGIEHIGDYALAYCDSLSSITLPKALKTLGDFAFESCDVIAEITLPEGLETIGRYAFDYCRNLTDIILPDSLTTLGEGAFRNCSSLKSAAIPEGITKLNGSTFWGCTNLSEVKLPEGLTEIGYSAFYGCTSLTQITLPEGLTSMGNQVFDKCTSLTSIEIPAGITYLPERTFYGCSALTSVKLPGGLESIGYAVFAYCTSLTEITLPDTVTSTGNSVFEQCSSLTDVTLPAGLTKIEDNMFRYCTALAEIEIPAGVTAMEDQVFYKCTSLTDVTLPEGMTKIGSSAFYGCTSLTGITLPEGLTELGSPAFYGCTNLTSIILPEGLTKLGASAFYGCTSLTSITLPEGLAELGSSAFYGCTNLTGITLPEGLTKLGSSAFYSCTSLTSITLPEGLTELGSSVFYGCIGLISIMLPENLKRVGPYAFSGCKNLASVYMGQEISYIDYGVFSGCEDVTLQVWPGSYAEEYALNCGIAYIYNNAFGHDGTLEVTLNPDTYKGMQLVLTFADFNMRCTVTDASSYTFAGLTVDAKCTIQVFNALGEVVQESEEIIIGKETKVTLKDMDAVGNLYACVTDEQGNEKTAQVEVKWYDEAGRLYASGAEILAVPAGKQLTCRIQLSSADGICYQIPEEITHTVTSGKNELQIQMKQIPMVTITGSISEGSNPISGASVTVSQKINGMYDRTVTAVTDRQGMFTVAVPAWEAQVTIYASGYAVKTMELADVTADTDMGVVALEAAAGAEITVDALLTGSATAGETAEAEQLTDLDNLEISVRNLSRNVDILDVLRQGMVLVLTENVAAGEELEITVSSLSGTFAPASAKVTLDEKLRASASLELTEYGSIRAAFDATKNETVQMLVYQENGMLADSSAADAGEKTIASGILKDGRYSVVMMGGSSFFTYPNSMEGLAQAGLTEGTDYVVQTVEVTSGVITECTFRNVPLLEESQFYYTNPEKTIFTSSKTQVSAGKFFTLRAATAFAEEYQGLVSDIQWVVELPEGLEYYTGTLTVDKLPTGYEQADNYLFIPVADPSLDLRLCVFATGDSEVRPAVYLQFTYEGKTVRQPIGSVTVKIDPFDFEVTGKSFDPSVRLCGTAAPGANIQVYDNGVLVGQTRSNGNGNWALNVGLYKPGTYSEHKLHAQMLLTSGSKIRSKTHTVLYQYSPDPVSVNTVTIYSRNDWGPTTTILDFKNDKVIGAEYSVYIFDTVITFVVDFTCEDVSRLSDVTLDIYLSDGSILQLPTVYDQEAGGFVASHEFKLNALPENVAVNYVYNGELVFAEESLIDLSNYIKTVEVMDNNLQNVNWDVYKDIVEPIELETDSTELPEYIDEEVKKYNRSVDELKNLLDDFNKQFEELYGSLSFSEGKITATGGICEISLEQNILPGFSGSETIPDGYNQYFIGNASRDPVFTNEKVDNGPSSEHRVISSDGTENVSHVSTSKNTTSDEMVKNTVDLMNIGKELTEQIGTVNDLQEGVGEALKDYNDKRFDDYKEKNKQLQNETDPAKKAQMKQELDIELKKISKMDDVVKRIKTGSEVLGPISDAISIWTFPESFTKNYSDWYELDQIAKETGNPEAKRLKLALAGRMATDAFSYLGGIVGITGLAITLVSGAAAAGFAAVSWPFALAAGIASLTYFLLRTDDKIDADIKKVKERYGFAGDTPLKAIVDPSGYIYEAVPSNRLAGVTVTCYERVTKYDIYDEPYDEIIQWDAGEYDQVNPVQTDNMGQYAWDVPAGWWQVKAELPGYETTYSEWLPVPPPQLDVNLGMVSYAVPEIADVYAQTNYVEVEFSKYMFAEDLTEDNITVSANGISIAGELELLNAEASPAKPAQLLASKLRFVPESELEEGTMVTVSVSSDVRSYADVAVEDGETAETTAIAVPDTLFAVDTMELVYKGTGTIVIQAKPANRTAGKTVQVNTVSDMMLKIEEESVTLDENGCAVVHVAGKLPGETEVIFTFGESKLQAKTTVLIRMPETGEILTDVESLSIAQKYIVLDCGESAALRSEIRPKKLADKILWSVENGGEKIIAVDADGTVTALSGGTAYVIASVSDGEITLTARCRVDVTEELVLDGVQLGTTNLTSELYSTDYAEVEILLQLPQNYPMLLKQRTNSGVAIREAKFADPNAAAIFDLNVQDDRHVQIIPKAEALENAKSVKSSYSSAITVTVGDKEYTTEEVLKLTVKKSTPKLKATISAFNSFYTGQSNAITITGGTATEIQLNTSAKTPIPSWLILEDGILTLTEDAPQKSVSGKVSLLVYTEEWRIPAQLTLSVKNSYKSPGLKLSASAVTLATDAANSVGIQLALQRTNKKDTLSALNVTDITAPTGYTITDFNAEDGIFTLKAEEGFKPGKIALNVTFSDTKTVLPLSLTVKTANVALKLAKSSVTLSGVVGDSAVIPVAVTPKDYRISEYVIEVTDTKGNDKSGELTCSYENGNLHVATTEATAANTSYKLYFTAAGKTVTLSIKTTDKAPDVSLKASNLMDLSFPEKVSVVTATFKNYNSGEISDYTWTITEMKGKTIVDANAAEKFLIEEDGSIFRIHAKDGAEIDIKSTYVLALKLALADGTELPEKAVNLTVKRTAVNLKLSKTKLTLNKTVADKASLAVTCTTKGYAFNKPIWTVTDSKGNAAAEGTLNISCIDGQLTVAVGENAAYGATYKVQLRANEYAPATTLTVSIPTEAKSQITGSIKVSGTLDVIRDGSAITVTPSYKNVTECSNVDEQLLIYSSADNYTEPVNYLFSISRNEAGTFVLTKADGAKIDHTKTYKVQLVTVFNDVMWVETKAANLSVKMGRVKLTLSAKDTTLFSGDKNDRAEFTVCCSDSAVNEIAEVTIKDSKYQELFEVYDYGNGKFALGFKDGQVDSKFIGKSITLTLNVKLMGNETEKANTTVNLKISITK